jgi:hypothetical protein
MRLETVALAAVGCVLLSSTASGAILASGTYPLANHPNGAIRPPNYGLRLDELVDVTPGVEDNFTFDFDHPSSNMQVTITSTSIRIFGNTYGGRDIGGSYAADAYLGLYAVDFTYSVGVGVLGGDDDYQVTGANFANTGTITLPGGSPIALMSDYAGSFGYSFQLGDEADDLGHQGAGPGTISGWGWLAVNGDTSGAKDWLFTVVPSPSALALLGMGGVMAGRRRRAR